MIAWRLELNIIPHQSCDQNEEESSGRPVKRGVPHPRPCIVDLQWDAFYCHQHERAAVLMYSKPRQFCQNAKQIYHLSNNKGRLTASWLLSMVCGAACMLPWTAFVGLIVSTKPVSRCLDFKSFSLNPYQYLKFVCQGKEITLEKQPFYVLKSRS